MHLSIDTKGVKNSCYIILKVSIAYTVIRGLQLLELKFNQKSKDVKKLEYKQIPNVFWEYDFVNMHLKKPLLIKLLLVILPKWFASYRLPRRLKSPYCVMWQNEILQSVPNEDSFKVLRNNFKWVRLFFEKFHRLEDCII